MWYPFCGACKRYLAANRKLPEPSVDTGMLIVLLQSEIAAHEVAVASFLSSYLSRSKPCVRHHVTVNKMNC